MIVAWGGQNPILEDVSMTGKTLMIMGTSSSAGKSLLATAVCRCFARRGVRVAPFKAQNMSNNAAVCADGAEIGRSQALQSLAASVPPHSDMNPILLKPEGDTRSQVIVNGRPMHSLEATDYYERRSQLWGHVTAALDRLREQHELVVIEGAGSPAELNLADVELVNMSVARYCRAPVLLVGDIERGGVFAQLLGTLWLLPPEDRALVRGLIVNKFRGDLRLFDRGVEILQERGDVPVLGVLPWIDALQLPEEDAVALLNGDTGAAATTHAGTPTVDIVVIHLPHVSNFDDFDPLASEPSVRLRYVRATETLGNPDVIVLPGTKNTLGDWDWLRSTGLAAAIGQLARSGTSVVGICGGYQILGRRMHDPSGQEADDRSADGLGLLDIETTFFEEKQTRQVRAEIVDDAIAPGCLGIWVTGYEIHHGTTRSDSAWLDREIDDSRSDEASDGARSDNGRVWGCYMHGLFHNDDFRVAWLRSVGVIERPSITNANARIRQSIDRLADAFESSIDMKQLEDIIWNPDPEAAHVE